VINGPGGLIMSGAGTLILNNSASLFAGGTAVLSGTVQAAADAVLGSGNVTGGSAGTLAFTGTTATARSFAMNGGTISVAAGQTVTFNGGPVSSAALVGGGTFATGATAGAQFFNVTTSAAVAIVSNSPADQFVNFTNSSALSVPAGINTAGTSTIPNLNGFTNESVGSITLGAASRINVANFQSYGTVTLNPAVVGSSQATLITNTGPSALSFNGGSQTFLGTPATAGPPSAPNFVAGIDLHGQNLVVAGGLFVNNGFVVDSGGGGNIVVDFGATYKGAGFTGVSVVTQNGGKVQAGNSPGAASYNSLTIGPGGITNFVWQINDAGPSVSFPHAPGVSGPTPNANNQVSGWSQLQANQITDPITHTTSTGNLTWTATSTPGNQFQLSVETLLGPQTTVGTSPDGAMADFDPGLTYFWPIITYTGSYSGPTDNATLTADTLIDLSGIGNAMAPGDAFFIHLDPFNHQIDLVTAIPEPSTLGLVTAGLIGVWRAGRRRRR
jgi:autotransporter-associated beta strand protein